MLENKPLDTLAEFHLRQDDSKVYALVAHIVAILEQSDQEKTAFIANNASNLLGEAESAAILKLFCRKHHVDYLQLLESCQIDSIRHISPKLLLHIACLPRTYVSEKLQVSGPQVDQLLAELHKNFTIDDPIEWLKRLLDQNTKQELRYQRAKDDLLHGLEPINQPVDTAEERRQKERRLRLNLRPPVTK